MKKVTEYPGFLTPKECKMVLDILDTNPIPGTGIRADPLTAEKLVKIVGPKLPGFKFTHHVSTGTNREAVTKHVDPKLDKKVTHKLLVYLSDMSSGGGTFFDNGGYVSPEKGKAVVFDITIPHWGEGFPKGEVKRVFGLRMYKET